MMPMAFYSFDVGPCRFFALDCLAADDPGTFDLWREQLEWLRGELVLARTAGKKCVFLLHCYPSELGESSLALGQLMRNYRVLLVDMGHTHYNEIAHDGQTLYTATRSTGQIEEGPVGFSVTNIDHGIVSWRFKALGEWPLVMITAPADERLRTHHGPYYPASAKRMRVRVKAWSEQKLIRGFVTIAERAAPLDAVPRSAVWEADLGIGDLREGVYRLGVELTDEIGRTGRDIARVAVHSSDPGKLNLRAGRDADNAIGAWPEHGILGTQLGPNKNGRKW
jgi:3',5'-cyclic-AMP phosphodiesterase